MEVLDKAISFVLGDTSKCLEQTQAGKDLTGIKRANIPEALTSLVALLSPPEPSQGSEQEKDEELDTNLTQPPPPPPSQNEVCQVHKKRPCPLKGKGCPLSHPPWCSKLMEFGLRKHHKKGCSKQDCPNIHPFVCFSSLKEKKCFNPKCKSAHLKGTQRKKPQQDSKRGPKPSQRGTTPVPQEPRVWSSPPPMMLPPPPPTWPAPEFRAPGSGSVTQQDFLRLEKMVLNLMNTVQHRLLPM